MNSLYNGLRSCDDVHVIRFFGTLPVMRRVYSEICGSFLQLHYPKQINSLRDISNSIVSWLSDLEVVRTTNLAHKLLGFVTHAILQRHISTNDMHWWPSGRIVPCQ